MVSSPSTDRTDVAALLTAFGERFDAAFSRLLESPSDVPKRLAESMCYSALAPGKRFRPFLLTRCCELVGGSFDDALGAAAAVECVHAFSLVHDDLPSMDDDDLRRGRPTNHKVYGEALAILAGDALVTLAFELIARHTPDPTLVARLVAELARGAGWQGMIGGQVADIAGESEPPDLDRVRYIHERKTASLIAAACRMGATVGGGTESDISQLGDYGKHVGLAFQIADDLLDVTSTPEAMGKAVGKDAVAGKQTYPGSVGARESQRAGLDAVETAVSALAPYGVAAKDLRILARFCLDRKH